MFRVGEEPPVIIKFFFDFLDAAAERHGITDPDVIHTWKCNRLFDFRYSSHLGHYMPNNITYGL